MIVDVIDIMNKVLQLHFNERIDISWYKIEIQMISKMVLVKTCDYKKFDWECAVSFVSKDI